MTLFCLDARTAVNHFPGIGRYVRNLAQAIVPQLADDERLLLLRDPSQPSRWQLPPESEKVTRLETAVSPFSLSQQWQIPRLLKQFDITVYHSPYYLMPYRYPWPVVLTLYDLIPQKYPQYVSARARLMFRLTTALAIRSSGRIIAISEATRQDIIAAYRLPPEKITAVPLAPDPHFRPQPTVEIERIRQKYNLPKTYAFYLGSNKPHKNLERLALAWEMAAQNSPHALIIAGAWDGRYPQAKELAAQKQINSIRFLGPVDDADLPALYSGAQLFIFPSLYEGFGLPVIEAMACGTAVTCSHTSSLPEVGGDAALYFDPFNVEEIAQQIGRLLTDTTLRQKLAAKGLAQAQKFSWRNTAAATLHLYRSPFTAHR
ncbi:MAG TPA: glycosyltransferase family 1 protein [Anaerolineae bacterium]|nr:glycosyltransferase family 1 protein [Anaerolineae bacterium]